MVTDKVISWLMIKCNWFFIFHDWFKWSDVYYGASHCGGGWYFQKRNCLECGKVEERVI